MKMKRSVCLSALMMACAAASHAQSGVTLWGVVDVNVQNFRAGGAGSQWAVGNGSLSTSQLGFRGVEDLGGGLKAGFWLEGSLNPDDGTGRATNKNNQSTGTGATTAGSFLFDRRSYVSLGGNWGEMRMGHDFVPTHYNSISFDPFNANGVARAGNFTFSGAANGPLFTAITASNTVSYWLPANLGGVYGVAMYGLGENSSTAPNPGDGRLASLRLGYARGPFDIAAAHSRTRYVSTATLGGYTHSNIGASWNFGVAKLFALYNVVRVDVAAGAVRKNSSELGAHIPVSPNGRIRLSYLRMDDRSASALLNANGTARSGNDASQWGVGYVHDLSKRTALYGTYAQITNRGQANYTVSGGLSPLPGLSARGAELGVRHLF